MSKTEDVANILVTYFSGNPMPEMGGHPISRLLPQHQRRYRDAAADVIRALREPDAGMLEATGWPSKNIPRNAWITMIDYILNEPAGGER